MMQAQGELEMVLHVAGFAVAFVAALVRCLVVSCGCWQLLGCWLLRHHAACVLAVQTPALSPTQQRYPSPRWRAAATVAADQQQLANAAIAPVAAGTLLA